MKFLRRLFAWLVLLGLGFWLWSALFPGPEKVIRKQLNRVARTVSFTANEGLLTRAAKLAEFEAYFSSDVQVDLDTPVSGRQTYTGRNEVVGGAASARKFVGALQVEFLDMAVALAADKLSAIVDLTAKGKVPGEREFYVQEMKFVLKKINGKWLIVRVETVKTLSRGLVSEGIAGS